LVVPGAGLRVYWRMRKVYPFFCLTCGETLLAPRISTLRAGGGGKRWLPSCGARVCCCCASHARARCSNAFFRGRGYNLVGTLPLCPSHTTLTCGLQTRFRRLACLRASRDGFARQARLPALPSGLLPSYAAPHYSRLISSGSVLVLLFAAICLSNACKPRIDFICARSFCGLFAEPGPPSFLLRRGPLRAVPHRCIFASSVTVWDVLSGSFTSGRWSVYGTG